MPPIHQRLRPSARDGQFDPPGREIQSDDDDAVQTGERAAYCRLIDAVPHPSCRVVGRLVRGQFPDEHMGVTRLAEGLDRIADALKITS